MFKVLALAAILAVLLSVQVHCTQPTLQDVLEERLKHEGAGLPKITTSPPSDQVAQVESRQEASIEEATTEPRTCNCDVNKSQLDTYESVEFKPPPYSSMDKKMKENTKKLVLAKTDKLKVDQGFIVVEMSPSEISEPSEVVSAPVDVPEPKEIQAEVAEVPEEPIESEEFEDVKVDKKGKGKNDKRKEEKKSKSNGKREKRSTKRGGKGKSSERKSKESSKGKSKRSKSKK